jgi:hypothetical protein
LPTSEARAKATIIDFGNVKDRGPFNTRHIESGEYAGKVTKVVSQDAKDGEPMWVFTVVLDEVPRASYPYYCKLVDNQFWKIKQLFTAAGVNVGQRKVKVDPNKLVGKRIGVYMEDDEYEGRLKSVIGEVMHLSEMTGAVTDESDDDEVGAEEDDIEDEVATRRAKKKSPAKKRPEPEEDDDLEEDDEEEEEEEPEPPRRRAKKAPAKKTSAKRKPAPVEDDEDEEDEDDDELEIDEL